MLKGLEWEVRGWEVIVESIQHRESFDMIDEEWLSQQLYLGPKTIENNLLDQFAFVQKIILAIVWLPLPPRYLYYTCITFGGRMVIKWELKPLPITYYGRRNFNQGRYQTASQVGISTMLWHRL